MKIPFANKIFYFFALECNGFHRRLILRENFDLFPLVWFCGFSQSQNFDISFTSCDSKVFIFSEYFFWVTFNEIIDKPVAVYTGPWIGECEIVLWLLTKIMLERQLVSILCLDDPVLLDRNLDPLPTLVFFFSKDRQVVLLEEF